MVGTARPQLNGRLLGTVVSVWLTVTLLGCTPAPQAPAAPEQEQQPARPSRVLRILNAGEPVHLTLKPVGQGQVLRLSTRLFNAGLTYVDEKEAFHPELAEALPQLGTDTWRVFPDGQMETTYRLKPNLTWHDGAPFSADDYVFAFQVYGGPELGLARSEPQRRMREIIAPDARTLVIRWREPYPDADSLASASSSGSPFVALPRHILEEPLLRGNSDAFAAQAYWSSEYVGLGPYRLDNWERGAFIEASAFDGYVLGRPKIDRVRVHFVTDPNTVMANLLAGTADVVAESTLRTEQGVLLRRDWESRGAGVVKFFPSGGRRSTLQFDPSRVSSPAFLDVRVRRALAHAIDKEALNEALVEGLGEPADTWVQPTVTYFADVQRAISRYPYDLRLAAQRLAEAGVEKGPDGFYAGQGGKLAVEISHATDTQYNKEAAIMADGLTRFGLETTQVPMAPRGVTAGSEVDFATIRNGGGGSIEVIYGSAQIPRPENRFTGNNVGSWLNPDYERLQGAFSTTLARAERIAQMVQMAQIISEEVPMIPLYYNVGAEAYVPELKGVNDGDRIGAFWNVHLWELR